MANLIDPVRRRCFCNALSNWRYTEFITFSEVAKDFVRK
jgi:hypothetical protein